MPVGLWCSKLLEWSDPPCLSKQSKFLLKKKKEKKKNKHQPHGDVGDKFIILTHELTYLEKQLRVSSGASYRIETTAVRKLDFKKGHELFEFDEGN